MLRLPSRSRRTSQGWSITREEPDVRERVFRADLFELCRRPISMVGGERNHVRQRTARKSQRKLGSPSKDESSRRRARP